MAEPETSPSLLPDELLEQICQAVENHGLKNIRCGSKRLCDIATPFLFRHWTLYPHIRSFEQLLNISRSPHIACHLNYLVYDARYLEVTKNLSERINEICTAEGFTQEKYLETVKKAWSLHKGTLSNRYSAYHALQTASLIQILGTVKNLKNMQVCEPGSWTRKDALPDFYRRLIKQHCSPLIFENGDADEIICQKQPYATMSYAIDVLIAVSLCAVSLHSLDVKGINWFEFLGNTSVPKWPGFHPGTFGELKELHLTTDNSIDIHIYDTMMDLREILKSATKLESLSLRFRYNDLSVNTYRDLIRRHDKMGGLSFFYPHKSQSLDPAPARLTWSSKLAFLHLGGLLCTADELESVLSDCASTLKVFELRDLYLMKPGRTYACLVAMLKWIRNSMALESFTARGWFTNGGMQNWYIPEEMDVVTSQAPERLLSSRVARYITKGGDCPLEFTAIPEGRIDLGIRDVGDKASSSFLEETFAGDETWRMVYPSKFFVVGGVDEDSDDDMGFGLFD